MSASTTRCRLRSAALPWLWCALFAMRIAAAERGLPLLTVYPAEVHKAGPQTFAVAQDSRGLLYFGNLHGLLTYDGAWWSLQSLPEEQAPLSIATDANGRVVIGLVNDFGSVARGASGAFEFHSLLPLVPAAKREFGDVRNVCSTSAGFLFVAEKTLLLWDGTKVRVGPEFDRENGPRDCYVDGGTIYLRGTNGLHTFDPATFRTQPAGLSGRVQLVLRGAGGTMIAAVRDQGLFTIDQGTSKPFAPAAGAWLKGKTVSAGVALRDGRFVIATRQNGLMILSANGEIEQFIGEDAGLPDSILNRALVDRDGSLWLAMEGPLVRIDLASPVTVFDVRHGLRGSAGDVARFDGKLYAVTSHGLHRIEENGNATLIDVKDSPWRVLPFDDEMLIGTTKGVYSMSRAGAITHVIDQEVEIYDVVRSPSDPNRVWLASRAGISSMRRANGKWTYEGLIPGVPEYISSVAEQNGAVWGGTVFDGIVRVDAPRSAKPRVAKYGRGEMNVARLGDRVVLVDARGAILEVDRSGKLVPDHLLGHIRAPRGFFVAAADPQGNIWINSTPPLMFARLADGTYAKEGHPLVSVTAADIQNVRVHGDVVWFAADKGLFRYDPNAAAETVAPQPAPLIRRVIAGENRALTSGASLPHDFGRMRIEFAPVSYRPGVSYQYRLDPIDARWSEWSTEPFIDYTTLEASHYVFRLRARGPAMTPSPETHWSFTVAPPWYRTPWAHALWALAFLALLLGVIQLRTNALHRQAVKLRETVAERTVELENTVKLLEDANAQLEALSLEDDLTGIANRRSFERALIDEWNRGRRHEQPLALVLLDLDHFKELNDRRGHPAGDDCLRRVGAFLAETIRRSGEVVARYGGEEFAILLPGVDADGAVRVADVLREGIERLGIPYGTVKDRRVTASCGAAALVPTSDLNPESLVASADRALYAAKHSGRNCVRLADESTTGTWLRDASA
ncbi:MAG TPA: diguanylate cyclase [Thermoanaerobaculia bacterium]|nr:diguanylate cyclase [Thermoanaerobaculia bacterium]